MACCCMAAVRRTHARRAALRGAQPARLDRLPLRRRTALRLAGHLNMADLAAKAAAVWPRKIGLARAGGLLLLAVFALKAALLPLHLWLPAAYAGTSAPVAALFAIMTKVGAYAILRTATLVFGDGAGALAGLFEPWLLPAALATLALSACSARSPRPASDVLPPGWWWPRSARCSPPSPWRCVGTVNGHRRRPLLPAARHLRGRPAVSAGRSAQAASPASADAFARCRRAALRAVGRGVLRRRRGGRRPAAVVGLRRQVPDPAAAAGQPWCGR
jgi:hypothetical protein